ncbi:winged helix DNA-binding protein [Streptomyces sp. NBC_01476]|uniref:MarR family winged helix-turn-helix transcriptional regulator n=1 Tax=Streptomyces sp. NBC_01476 TaxID=2903881 RepID=UPI002E352E33|nr:MarR family transcriptional regulator [Streptomyces sp. NBC_01476]
MRPAEEIRYLILAAQREGNRRLAQELRPLGITPSQAEVLRLLADRQPLALSELGELLVCESGNNPSRLVDRLVAAGLVRRDEGTQDRRRVALTLTPEGAATAGQVVEVEERLYGRIDEAAAAYDAHAVADFLRALVSGEPSGLALARRMATQAR